MKGKNDPAARSFSGRELWVLGLAALIGLVVVPCLNAFVPPGHPLHVETFTLSVYGKYLTYAVLALGVNLLWGYTGLLSLGQCLFFALGGYALGMHLMLLIGRLGQYRMDLPDFMVFLEFPAKYPETDGLPLHWIPFRHAWFAILAVVLVPAAVAFIFGLLAFRSRIKGVYFSILSQALTYAACLMFFRNDFSFGGNNGLTDFKFILGTPALEAGEIRDPGPLLARLSGATNGIAGHVWEQIPEERRAEMMDASRSDAERSAVLRDELNRLMAAETLYEEGRFAGVALPAAVRTLAAENPRDAQLLRLNRLLLEAAFPGEFPTKAFKGYIVNTPETKRALYVCSALLLLGTYLFCRWLTGTRFGLIQRAIRDSENRVLFSGYATAHFKLLVFVAAAVISGLGGALFVPQAGIINPSEMAPEKSLEAVVWVAVGGRGSLAGPVIGAIGINALKSYATHALAEQWPYILGALFIFVTLFMPNGIVGLPKQLGALKKRWAARKSVAPEAALAAVEPPREPASK
ncbi:MAG TPA: hypothetical protein PLK78_09140 [Verrucomicrobiota bacterium]|nr:hypothetical protein [Verrucomicrobiota bacterium]